MSIRRMGILGLLICIPWLLRAAEEPATTPVRFSPYPMEGKKILHEPFYDLAAYPQQALGRLVELVDFNDYGELLQAFRDIAVEPTYLGPLPYALPASTDEDLEPVVCVRETDGQSHYARSRVVFGAEPIDCHAPEFLDLFEGLLSLSEASP